MPHYDKYRPNYKRMYPDVQISPEVLRVLRQSDRKMEYMEYDLKSETFVQDLENNSAVFSASREDSYERLQEDEQKQFSDTSAEVESKIIHNENLRLLRLALESLAEDEYEIIIGIFYGGLSERELGKQMKIHHMTVHSRKQRALEKMRKFFK